MIWAREQDERMDKRKKRRTGGPSGGSSGTHVWPGLIRARATALGTDEMRTWRELGPVHRSVNEMREREG